MLVICSEKLKSKNEVVQVLVILTPRIKRKLAVGFRVMVTLFVLVLMIGHLYNMYHDNELFKQGWLRDDKPSGNPMRVEEQTRETAENPQSVLNQFVGKVRDFYHRDQ
ncbi:hypothetical protein [Phosphitispora sp. TUW77]|uniref:hypothetical protein n=1 Tax=Phosphitispora sp. TUW77 TaxID=3152361 RepID=UPI003AB48729